MTRLMKSLLSSSGYLKITMSKEGLSFDIEPDKNDAVIFVDIPYATTKLEKATADADGNLVFNGEIGWRWNLQRLRVK